MHPYVKKLMKTFFSFFVCKHNMSLALQKGWKKGVIARTPSPAIQNKIIEILCVSKLLKLEAELLKLER